jgi:MFS transporter, PPP family, 3-phenylpropionic acid transporter
MSGPSLQIPKLPIALQYATYFAAIGVFIVYLGLYLKSLGFNAQEIALLMASTQIVRIFTPTIWGWIADHTHSRMPIARWTFAAATALSGLMFFAGTFWQIFAVLVVMSGFWSALMPLFESTVVRYLSANGTQPMNLGLYGRLRVWGSLAYIGAVALAGMAFDHIEIRWLLTITTALLATTAVAAFIMPDLPSKDAPQEGGPIADVLRKPYVLAFLASCFFNALAQGAMFVFYGIYLVDHGYSKTMVGLLTSTAVVAEIFVMLWLKAVFSRFTHYSLWIASFAVTALRFVLVAEFPQIVALQFFAQVLHLFTWGTYHATAIAVVQQQFPGRLATRGQAIYTSVSYALGGAVGAFLSGQLWQRFGAEVTFLSSAVFAACGLALALIWPQALRMLVTEKRA